MESGDFLMNKKEILELIDEFKSGLLSKATNGDLPDHEYKRMREQLLSLPSVKDHIPSFIKANRSSADFRGYMQAQSENYRDRRAIINGEMNDLYDYIESLEDTESDSFSGIMMYKKCERIGGGGFGEVFRYHNDFLDLDFAVKIFQPMFATANEKKEGEKRFFREAKILFSLNHENIVRIYDAGRTENSPFIRMELIKGKALDKYYEEFGQYDCKTALLAILQILRGLECAHKADIIHRDLKPSNIMVVKDDEKLTYKIIDFGISAFMDNEQYTKLTRTGEHIAGGQFIDPCLDANPQLRDPRSDIYSVGAILYYMLCGRPPAGSDIFEILNASNQDISSDVEMIIKTALSNDLEKRYSSCSEMANAIKKVIKTKQSSSLNLTADSLDNDSCVISRKMIVDENELKIQFFNYAVKYSIERFLASDPQIGLLYELAEEEDLFEICVQDLLYCSPMLSNSVSYCDINNFLNNISHYHARLTEYTELKGVHLIATNPFHESTIEKEILELQEFRNRVATLYNNLKCIV